MKQTVFLLLLEALFFSFIFFYRGFDDSHIIVTKSPNQTRETLFPYQCIDTMKVSRDKARSLAADPQKETIIRNQVQTIASLGANCIAIGTPYDEEFLPTLRLWVKEARNARLHIWFRGNWSAWEGWFDREKKQTTEEHINQTVFFILMHPELFSDGDIFSPNVEPENGAPFSPIDTDEKKHDFKNYLIKEQLEVKRAFTLIKKSVITSWVSLSGGVAKSALDDKTIAALNYTVTLDHYVKSPEGIAEYIAYFNNQYHTRLVFGEFGAPIPDINGEMSNQEQASFVKKLFTELFTYRDLIDGVNYWTLSESSTALLDDDGTAKPVVDVIKEYYMPGSIEIAATDVKGKPLEGVTVTTQDKTIALKTDKLGKTQMIVPQGTYQITLINKQGVKLRTVVTVKEKEQAIASARFGNKTSLFFTIRNFLRRNITHTFQSSGI